MILVFLFSSVSNLFSLILSRFSLAYMAMALVYFSAFRPSYTRAPHVMFIIHAIVS